MKREKMILFALLTVLVFLIVNISADIYEKISEARRTPQEKVLDLANEIKHENSAACVVLSTLSGSMLNGDEKRLASMMGIYAQFMKDSLEGLK